MPATSIDNAFTARSMLGRAQRPDLCRRAVLHAAQIHQEREGRRCRRLGHSVRCRRHQPAGRALRAAGDPPRLGDLRQRSAISVQPRPVRRRWRWSTMAIACSTTATTRRRPRAIEREAAKLLKSGAFLLSLGGDHFVTWPLLKAHAAVHGPLALVQFDAHQDTWFDDGKRIDHGSFVARAVRAGHHRPGPLDPDRHPHPCARGFRHQDPLRPRGRGDARRRHRLCDRRAHRRQEDLRHLRHRLPRSGLRAGHRHAGRGRTVVGQDPVGAAPARPGRHRRRRCRRGCAGLRSCRYNGDRRRDGGHALSRPAGRTERHATAAWRIDSRTCGIESGNGLSPLEILSGIVDRT